MCFSNIIEQIVCLLIVSAGVVSCNKNNQESAPEPTHDVEIVFDSEIAEEVLTFKVLQDYASDKTIKTIYLIPTGHWNGNIAANITQMRKRFFQPRMELSPKIRGRGDLDFKLGEASKVPEDSLWYVQQGWTINKAYQKP